MSLWLFQVDAAENWRGSGLTYQNAC